MSWSSHTGWWWRLTLLTILALPGPLAWSEPASTHKDPQERKQKQKHKKKHKQKQKPKDPNRFEWGLLPELSYSSDMGFGFGFQGSLAKYKPGFWPFYWRLTVSLSNGRLVKKSRFSESLWPMCSAAAVPPARAASYFVRVFSSPARTVARFWEGRVYSSSTPNHRDQKPRDLESSDRAVRRASTIFRWG